MNKNKLLTVVLLSVIATLSNLKAETISIYDDSFSVTGIPVGSPASFLSGRWGLWDAGTSTFIQGITTGLNAGYVDLSSPELSITLNQTTPANYSAGTQMALAIFANTTISDSGSLNWTSAGVNYGAVLTDSSWIAPAFANNANSVDFTFSSSTLAQKGSYSFNGGNQIIGVVNLAAVPEPSVASLFALGTVGLVALRARRKS